MWVAYIGIEAVRLQSGWHGNVAVSGQALLLFLVLSVVVCVAHVYWLWFQVWVFHLDWILSWTALVLIILEVLMAAKVLVQTSSSNNNRRRR